MSIPKGWIGCPKNANKLVVSKFMSIKTPLDSRYNNKLPFNEHFIPEEIFLKARRNHVKIGLWINLCNTDRYYSKADIEQQNCIYERIGCMGHGKCPSRYEINRFISVVHNFVLRKPHDCIVVHCTHGFNRTGFMIVTFLVENLGFTIQQAFEAFANARPPGIYREQYIVELFTYYSNSKPPPTPITPSWCPQEDRQRIRQRSYQ